MQIPLVIENLAPKGNLVCYFDVTKPRGNSILAVPVFILGRKFGTHHGLTPIGWGPFENEVPSGNITNVQGTKPRHTLVRSEQDAKALKNRPERRLQLRRCGLPYEWCSFVSPTCVGPVFLLRDLSTSISTCCVCPSVWSCLISLLPYVPRLQLSQILYFLWPLAGLPALLLCFY